MGTYQYCGLKPKEPKFEDDVQGRRLNLILSRGNYWANGTTIKYWFNEGPEDQKQLVRESFQKWVDVGIGLKFAEVQDRNTADVRIGFVYGDGSWSVIGTDCHTVPKDQNTMNIGWDISPNIPRPQPDTAVHEIGHAIGFPHEHQNPKNGIVWNVEEVYKSLRQSQGWSDAVIEHNVLRKLGTAEVKEATKWDVDSVMHYPFEAGLILVPETYKTHNLVPNHPGPSYLSDMDKIAVKTYYPPIAPSFASSTSTSTSTLDAPLITQLEEFKSLPVTLEEGKSADFAITPAQDQFVVIQAVGAVDTTLVLFKVDPKTNERTKIDAIANVGKKFGESSNLMAQIVGGQHYVVNVRLISKYRSGKMALLYYTA